MRWVSRSKGGCSHLRPCDPQEELALVVHQELKGIVNTSNPNKTFLSLTVASIQKIKESILDDGEFLNVRQGPDFGSRSLVIAVMEAKGSSVP